MYLQVIIKHIYLALPKLKDIVLNKVKKVKISNTFHYGKKAIKSEAQTFILLNLKTKYI